MTRRETALHEAGHAVAQVLLCLPLEYASIRRGKTFGGVVVPAPMEIDVNGIQHGRVSQQLPSLRSIVERRIISTLAGELAARYLAAEPAPAGYVDDETETIAREALQRLGPRLAELVVHHEQAEDTGSDEANAWKDAGIFADGEPQAAYLAWLRAEARLLVTTYAPAILRVADALEKYAVLNGEQVAALVHSHLNRSDPMPDIHQERHDAAVAARESAQAAEARAAALHSAKTDVERRELEVADRRLQIAAADDPLQRSRLEKALGIGLARLGWAQEELRKVESQS
jgi:hypothetical protein